MSETGNLCAQAMEALCNEALCNELNFELLCLVRVSRELEEVAICNSLYSRKSASAVREMNEISRQVRQKLVDRYCQIITEVVSSLDIGRLETLSNS